MNKKLALAFLIISFLVGDVYGMTAEKWMATYKNPDIAEKTREVLKVYLIR